MIRTIFMFLVCLGVACETVGATGRAFTKRTDNSPPVVDVIESTVSNLITHVGERWEKSAAGRSNLWQRAFRSKRHDAFKAGKDRLAIITAGKKTGTGFLMKDAGLIWLVSNAHVVRDAPRVYATMLDGSYLALGERQYADGRDLVRFPVKGRNLGFELNPSVPTVGDRVTVLGNTDGCGVITEIKGRVVGVGPKEIEIDAQFLPGNSGSPVLDESGRLLAVATYLRNCRNDRDWTKRGTRFNTVRRFAVRLIGVRWLPAASR